MYKKFAVYNVIENDIYVLKTFDIDAKEEAIAYGESLLSTDFKGVLAVGIIPVDEDGNKVSDSARVYRVWYQEDKRSVER